MSYTPIPENPRRWRSITKLLRNLFNFGLNPSAREIKASLCTMDRGDSLVVHTRAQNAAVIIRSLHDTMRFDIFEVSAPNDKVMGGGKLLREFPGPAIAIPHSMTEDNDFISGLAIFFSRMSAEAIEAIHDVKKDASFMRTSRHNCCNFDDTCRCIPMSSLSLGATYLFSLLSCISAYHIPISSLSLISAYHRCLFVTVHKRPSCHYCISSLY